MCTWRSYDAGAQLLVVTVVAPVRAGEPLTISYDQVRYGIAAKCDSI